MCSTSNYDIQQACYPFAIISDKQWFDSLLKNVLQADSRPPPAAAWRPPGVGEVHRLHPLLLAAGSPTLSPGLGGAEGGQADPLPPGEELHSCLAHPPTFLPSLLSHSKPEQSHPRGDK